MKFIQISLIAMFFLLAQINLSAQRTTKQQMVGTWKTSLVQDVEEGLKVKVSMVISYASNGNQRLLVTLRYIIKGEETKDMIIMVVNGTWDINESYRKTTLEEEMISCKTTRNLVAEYVPDPCEEMIFLGSDEGETEILAINSEQMIFKITDPIEEDLILTLKKI